MTTSVCTNQLSKIGEQLVAAANQEQVPSSELLKTLFPYIEQASPKMSSRAISKWLADNHQIKISPATILRALKKGWDTKAFEKLGFQPHEINLIQGVLQRGTGMLLVCGPTASGKSTTLSTCARTLLQQPRFSMVTVENPVECKLPGAHQMSATESTLGQCVKAALRSDPDCILVGEMRKEEHLSFALDAAITGHSVLTTLAVKSAVQAPARLLSMGGSPEIVARALSAVTAQILVRTLCPICAKPAQTLPSKEEMRGGGISATWLRKKAGRLMEPVGCDACGGTGYKGRMLIAEGFSNSPEIKRIITRENGDPQAIRNEMHAQGGKSLGQQAINLAATGVVALTDAIKLLSLD